MFRDFDAALREKVGGRPDFVLGGQKFTCRAKLPWKKFSTMLLQLQTGTVPDGKTELEQTEDFFKMVLISADRQRFLDLLNKDSEEDEEDSEDEEGVASNLQVGELLDWLMSYYTGNEKDKEEPKEEVKAPEVAGPPQLVSISPKA